MNEKTKNKGGRPQAVIDWDKVDEHLRAGCSGAGIAGALGIHEDTLYRACERDNKVGFAAYSAQKRETGDCMLHLQQFNLAMSGDRGMLIWLGKQRLGQRDKIDQDVDAKISALEPITGMIVI